MKETKFVVAYLGDDGHEYIYLERLNLEEARKDKEWLLENGSAAWIMMISYVE